ncbi:hypothetical protein H4R26_002782 [Coemansia thaxteri]|uniref:Metaxin n=1 Tax=Coemansia thaxteri TaxID=2663907 RepID=A0A9W8BJ70_9FUNG|nr:hypothetical protein H4R26_002782 [Coemansia thaxteri]
MYSLYSWGSPFKPEGLYSFDPSCISIQTYLQLSKAEWQLHHVNGAGMSSSGCLPVLTCEQTAAESGFWRIVQFLKSEGYDLNAELDEEQVAQSIAYISMVQDHLVDALLFSWYMVPENFAGAIRPRLANLFGFPLSFVIPTQLRDYAEGRLESRGIHCGATATSSTDSSSGGSTGLSALKDKIPRIYLLAKEGFSSHEDRSGHHVYAQSSKCLDLLSKKLDKKDYFYGGKPTTLDTVVYGYLSLMLYPDLPQNTLKSMIVKDYPNLADFCNRIHAQLEAPDVASEPSWAAGVGQIIKQSLPQFDVFGSYSLARAKDDPDLASKLLSVASALVAFFGYALYNGIIPVPDLKPRPSAESAPHVFTTSDLLAAIKQSPPNAPAEQA